MMNERGKSDPAVVAAKLANKAERSAAEPGEPRAGTKGNANQQHTGRTQSRETVSQVLARIRQTARERKKERFTALFHHINVELLRDAFFAIRREAAPGVDGVTWQDYAANVETNLRLQLHCFPVSIIVVASLRAAWISSYVPTMLILWIACGRSGASTLIQLLAHQACRCTTSLS